MTTLTHEAFSQQLNTTFQTRVEGDTCVQLQLTAVSELLQTPRQERFSIEFRGPADRFLGQGMRELEHPKMGMIDLFLVPIGHGEQGYYYESVFNRLRQQPAASLQT